MRFKKYFLISLLFYMCFLIQIYKKTHIYNKEIILFITLFIIIVRKGRGQGRDTF
jgi:hypothetical protein